MNLLFNLVAVQPIHSAKFHGGGSYGEVVFRALVKDGYEGCKIFCAYDGCKYLNSELVELCKAKNIPLMDIREKSPQQIIDENKVDAFYTPLYSLEARWQIKVPRFVFTWHGVRALELCYSSLGWSFSKKLGQKLESLVRYRKSWKKYFYKPKYKQLAARIAQGQTQAITVSEHSRASIKGFFPELRHAEIPVFYSPMEEGLACCGEANDSLPDGVSPKKYFLLTSGARWEKNNLRAVIALDELIDDYKKCGEKFPYKVVVTGATNKKVYLNKIRHKEFFVLLDYVENHELEMLHQHAYAFIFPSLNEGFGYPPMQSMSYGVPVAASGTTSIPEVCGDAAIYFDPYSVSEIKNRIIQLLDLEIYQEYSARAKMRYAQVHERQKTDLQKTVDFILGK
ncbi:MAG: glycosyltransferase [Fibrobacteraceae bacterium]|nr:glycosyltransferase [Fibrobacteraceae bacterium]